MVNPSEGYAKPKRRFGLDGKPMTDDERRAVDSLERLARRWPKTLMLASMAGSLQVMRLTEDGDHPMLIQDLDGGMDPDAVIATIPIRNTGGDW